MKEINEKDLEMAAGGFTGMQFPKEEHHQDDGQTVHMGNYTCEKHERKEGSNIPFNWCENCVHGERRPGWKNEYACGLGM